MKKLYLVALAMIGIYACVNLSSCSKDDKEEPSKPDASVKMRPTKITWTENAQDPSLSDIYVYDNIIYGKGLQVLSYRYEEFGEYHDVTYEYNDNSIITTISDWKTKNTREAVYDQGEVTYNLRNGHIFSSDAGSYAFQYDNNYLSTIAKGGVSNNYIWQNNNITKIEMFYSDKYSVYSTTTITYTDHPLYVWIASEDSSNEPFDDCDQFLVRQGYYGSMPKNLIKEITWTNEENGRQDKTTYEYEFNENGYPTKITASTLYKLTNLFMNVVEIEWEKYQ